MANLLLWLVKELFRSIKIQIPHCKNILKAKNPELEVLLSESTKLC